MVRSGTIDTDVNKILWTSGWHWVKLLFGLPILGLIIIFTVENSLAVILGFLLFFFGPIYAVATLIYVHLNKSDVIDPGLDQLAEEVEQITQLEESDTDRHTLTADSGDSHLFLPAPIREVTTLLVEDSLLLVHDSAKLELPSLSWQVGDRTKEFYYDHITGVSYEPFDDLDDRILKEELEDEEIEIKAGGLFYLTTSDGNREYWETEDDANRALKDVQNRVRAFKAS